MICYVGITIGPIFDTISNATIPAALWFASYLFSDLSRRICAGVSAISGAEIISPFYDNTQPDNDGVGKYHDRIIFSTASFNDKSALDRELKAVMDTVVSQTGGVFPEEAIEPYSREQFQTFLKEYLQIHYVILSAEDTGGNNAIQALSPYLDALELLKTFPMDSAIDPFRRMFARKDVLIDNGNRLIKKSTLFPANDKNFLTVRGGRIRSVSEIARAAKNSERKRDYYYAVVYADGDNMGKFLQGLDNESVGVFSKGCLDYDKRAAKMISDYGGMPIYAGGDDLLFLAPLTGTVNAAQGDIVSLCGALRDLFVNSIRVNVFSEKDTPTLSFGVAVQFEKFPLYEALERARDLLYQAKQATYQNKKDNILLELRKHSGQSAALLVHNPDLEAFEALSKAARGEDVDSEKPTAILYTLEHFHAVISVLLDKTRTHLLSGDAPESVQADFLAAWGNLFDKPGQEVSKNYTDGIGEAYFTQLLLENRRVLVPGYAVPGEFKDNSLRSLVNVLILEKFMREKVGEEELRDSRKTEGGGTA